MCNTPVLDRVCRESYTDPREVYAQLKRRGMMLMTPTDHDSIDGAEPLRRHADFFLSEEVTCTMTSGTEIHLGVYAISERDHAEIARRRCDFLSLLVYLSERRLFFTLNHLFSSLTGRRNAGDFHWFASYVPAFETRNGQMLPRQNREAEALAAQLGKISVGGSDAHTIESAGTTYTEVSGARNAEEFFAGLRAGRGVVRGQHGSYAKLTADVLRITGQMLCESPWTVLLAPLASLVPLATLGHIANEMLFTSYWSARLGRAGQSPRRLWQLGADTVQ